MSQRYGVYLSRQNMILYVGQYGYDLMTARSRAKMFKQGSDLHADGKSIKRLTKKTNKSQRTIKSQTYQPTVLFNHH